MKIKTVDLIGAALDWAVGRAVIPITCGPVIYEGGVFYSEATHDNFIKWNPSCNWGQGGPLIDRFDVYFDRYTLDQPGFVLARIGADYQFGSNYFNTPSSPTRLVAAMRAIVADRLGNEIEVPEGLISWKNNLHQDLPWRPTCWVGGMSKHRLWPDIQWLDCEERQLCDLSDGDRRKYAATKATAAILRAMRK